MAGACGPRNRRRATHISQHNPQGHPNRRLQYGLLEEARPSAFLSLCGAEGHVLNHTPAPAIWMSPRSVQNHETAYSGYHISHGGSSEDAHIAGSRAAETRLARQLGAEPL